LAHIVPSGPRTRVSVGRRNECEVIARFVGFGMVVAP
jgi:hypothetical protein